MVFESRLMPFLNIEKVISENYVWSIDPDQDITVGSTVIMTVNGFRIEAKVTYIDMLYCNDEVLDNPHFDWEDGECDLVERAKALKEKQNGSQLAK